VDGEDRAGPERTGQESADGRGGRRAAGGGRRAAGGGRRAAENVNHVEVVRS
jgi:hypothetical protein